MVMTICIKVTAIATTTTTTTTTSPVTLTLALLPPLLQAIVDTGTSEIAVPTPYYSTLLTAITSGMNCHDTVCYSVTLDDFPDLVLGLYPDNELPLRAEDYVTCSHWGQCVIRLQEVGSGGGGGNNSSSSSSSNRF